MAFFGSEGLYCYDFAGNLKWKRDFGRLHSGPYDAPKLEWGFSSSPIIYDGRVIIQCDCLYSASAVAADGHLYFVSEQGRVTVIKEGRMFSAVSTIEMAEVVMATPAISGDRLLIRTVNHLFCAAGN